MFSAGSSYCCNLMFSAQSRCNYILTEKFKSELAIVIKLKPCNYPILSDTNVMSFRGFNNLSISDCHT